MLRKTWFRATLILLAALVAVLVIASRPPSFPAIAPARKVAAADLGSVSPGIAPFAARYGRWQALLGVRVSSGEAVVTVQIRDGKLEAVFDMTGMDGVDRMQLDPRTLVLEARRFGPTPGPGQSFVRTGNRMDVEIRDATGATERRQFEFDVPVLEPSLLELPFALLKLEPGDEGHLPWTNYGDPGNIWLPFRALARERVEAAGRTHDTVIVRTAFPGGRMRDYWIVDTPPYKVRMVAYENGRLITTGWELEEVEARD